MVSHRRVLIGLLKASHFGPTLLVVSITYLLSLTQFSWLESLEIAVAILAGQFVVGWSNDLIDLPRDSAASRNKKPLVAGDLSAAFLMKSIFVALLLAYALSLFGPLGVKGTAIHALGIFSATLYNLKLKSTILSPLPYVLSFGALPWAIYEAAEKHPPVWLYFGFIFFATAFHFLNVIKDLEWDISQGVLGLPQRLGKTPSILAALFLILAGIVDILTR